MSHKFEKSVKGATKIKLAPPKSKYIDHILVATHTGEAGVAEIFRILHLRLRDSAWTVIFKALIVTHLMVREGQANATLQYMAANPKKLAISTYSEVQTQGYNIRRYSEYLIARARAFENTKVDHVRSGQGRMRRLTVEKGLLRETEIIQKQIRALLRCDLLTDEPENEITLTAFRLLTLDLLSLYSAMNEGTINVLERYFEMSRPDSERALKIYKTFTAQTEEVVGFLGVARRFESATRLEIPNLKHASTDLTRLLEDDLNDPDFDLRRREYVAQKEAKSGPRRTASTSNDTAPARRGPSPQPALNRPQTAPKPEGKANQPDLIDFFESIEVGQQTMGQPSHMQPNNFHQQQQPPPPPMQFQQTGFQPQQPGFYVQQTGVQQPQPTGLGQSAGFGSVFSPQGTGTFGQQQAYQPGQGFGVYQAQSQMQGFQSNQPPISQGNIVASQQQPQSTPAPLQPQATNPFRQSMLTGTPTGGGGGPTPLSRQNTNPFAKRLSTANPQFNAGSQDWAFPSQAQQPAQPLQVQRTGTNPFSRSSPVPSQQQQGLQPLQRNPTGSTNPFRQSAFVNQQTGQGWQAGGQQGAMGGLEQLDTIPVFPRPGM